MYPPEAWFGIATTLCMATDHSAFRFLPGLYPWKRFREQLGSSDLGDFLGDKKKQPNAEMLFKGLVKNLLFAWLVLSF